MTGKGDRTAEAQARALDIERRLTAIRPADLTERQWALKAGVSPSFFSNLRGTPTKGPSEPSVGNLRAMLHVAGTTLPVFFADDEVPAAPVHAGVAEAPAGFEAAPPSKADRAAEAQHRAKSLADRLDAIRPADLSPRQWCLAAGVSTSFFANMRGTPTHPPSEPGIGKLRAILEAAGTSLPEFFAAEARRPLAVAPSEPALERALLDAMPGLPKGAEQRARYLAQVVLKLLELPRDRAASRASADRTAAAARAAAAPPRAATS